MVHICARTRSFLNAPGIHHFPSRVWLDACCWRYCLFPEPWLKTLKFLNSPSAQTARIFARFLNGSLPEIIRGLTTGICARTSCFLKAVVFQYFTSRVGERLMQLFCAAACFLLTSGTSLQASKLGWS